MKPTITVYTAIIWSYDVVLEQVKQTLKCEFVVFTDNQDIKFENKEAEKQWKVVLLDRFWKYPPRLTARYIKTHPYEFLPETDIAIRMDWNWMLLEKHSLVSLVIQLKNNVVVTFQHPNRSDPYQEAHFITTLKQKRFQWMDKAIDKQMSRYLEEWLPLWCWLSATSMLISKNTVEASTFFGCWREEIKNETNRDQLSFDYIVWKLKAKVEWFVLGYGNNYRQNKYVSFLTQHRENV